MRTISFVIIGAFQDWTSVGSPVCENILLEDQFVIILLAILYPHEFIWRLRIPNTDTSRDECANKGNNGSFLKIGIWTPQNTWRKGSDATKKSNSQTHYHITKLPLLNKFDFHIIV